MSDDASDTATTARWPGITQLLTRTYAPLAVGLLLLLAALIAISPAFLIYDERYYMQASRILANSGSFDVLMRTRSDIAAGPLYPYLHVILSPLTGLGAPAIRYINFACLLISLAAMAWTMRLMQLSVPWLRAAMLLAVPMIWPTSGMALTELPALAFASLAVALAGQGAVTASALSRLRLFALSGLLAGIAITGRQTYLPALAGYLLLALAEPRLRGPGLVGLLVAGAALAPMLIAWHGLTPPWQTQLTQGLVPEYGVLAFVYLATATLLIAPNFYRSVLISAKLRWVIAAVVVGAVLTCLVTGFRIEVAARVIDKLPHQLHLPAQIGATVVMVSIAATMAIAGVANLVEFRRDRVFVLLVLLALALDGTAIAVSHQFSSRYVLVAFPFALLALQRWWTWNGWASLRLAIGASMGLASLAAYYWNEPPAVPATKVAMPLQ